MPEICEGFALFSSTCQALAAQCLYHILWAALELGAGQAMFFILSKLIGVLVEPILHPLLLAAAGWILRIWSRKIAYYCFIAACILPCIYSLSAFSTLVMRPLENAIPPAPSEQIATADGIVILGGYTGSGIVAESRNQFTASGAIERLLEGLYLHKSFPEKPIWITGFSGSLIPTGWSEAENTKAILDALQFTSDKIKFENRARNTYQNAIYTFEAAQPSPNQKWVLITSAAHMPRAAGAFRAAGWPDMLYLPTDYRTRKSGFSWAFAPQENFSILSSAFHEYVGILVYWATGRYVTND